MNEPDEKDDKEPEQPDEEPAVRSDARVQLEPVRIALRSGGDDQEQ